MTRKRKRPLILVRDLEPGSEVDAYFLVRRFSSGAGNGPKLRGRIWDRSGEASLIAWEWNQGSVPTDGAYRVVGSVSVYAGQTQVCAELVEPCPPDADLQELLPSASQPIESLWSELERLCRSCAHPGLQALLHSFLADEDLCECLRRAPAAARHHHAYAGGLLEHTVSVARLSLSLAEHFPTLDKDLLLAGALLHDIGKTEAYVITGPPDMTDRGRLLGHIYPGARLVEERIRCLPGFPDDLRDRLLHLIGSHHGERQWGVLEVPRIPEAIVLHYADNLDAKMNAVFAACDQAQGETWTAPVRSLDDQRFYLGANGKAAEAGDDEPPELLREGLFPLDSFLGDGLEE